MGRQIITEQFLPNEGKTVKSESFGGQLGGPKFCVSGVLFKFAIPDGKLIITSAAANKVAGHELRCCAALSQASVAGLHVPLMCLVDFAGYRLVATCVLPISHNTLVVGTSDGGKKIKLTPLFFFFFFFFTLFNRAQIPRCWRSCVPLAGF